MTIYGERNWRNSYDQATSDLHNVVIRVVIDLAEFHSRYDSIAVSGISGIMVGAPVALMTGKALIIIRKDNETSHTSMHPGIGLVGARYLFLDDLVSTGKTRRRVEIAILKMAPKAIMVGQYMYDQPDHDNPFRWCDGKDGDYS